MKMYDREFHKSIENDEQPQAEQLAKYINYFIKPSKFIDFGCSSGLYLREVKNLMPELESVGYEFSKDAIEYALCSDINQCDLTLPLVIEKVPNTLGLCLEVLEHIDDIHWKQVLQNLTDYCDKLIFSAAFIGQGGVGHINCRNKTDWISRFESIGWIVDETQTNIMQDFMKESPHMMWFDSNSMLLVPSKTNFA